MFAKLLISLVAATLYPVMAFGECKEGKVAVTIVNPAGNVIELCVPEAAVPGLENAADRSGGTIIPATCPCFSVDALVETFDDPDAECLDSPAPLTRQFGFHIIGEKIPFAFTIARTDSESECRVNLTSGPFSSIITTDELDACNAFIYAAANELGIMCVLEELACTQKTDCAPAEYCLKSEGDCGGLGECQAMPGACVEVWDPVCGCDGNTYTNSCHAAAAGVSVALSDVCP